MGKNDLRDAEDQVEKPLILVVEDDFELRTVVSSELAEEFEVLEADHGRDGLEMALEHAPDLVVTDILMPVMDGVELCRELKAQLATSHIPVIMLTSQSSVENQIEGLDTGADAYITKPFHMELLMARAGWCTEASASSWREQEVRRSLKAPMTRRHWICRS